MGDEETGPTYQLLTKNSDGTDGEALGTSKGFDGKGVATHENGDVYDGVFLGGKRNGHGVYTFAANKDKFDGGYNDNKRVGLGKYVYSSKTGNPEIDDAEDAPARGGVYHGNYDGFRSGKGVFKYVNGDTYSGDWKNGKKHGQGSYRYASDGSSLVGKWEDGTFVDGKWVLATGVFFVGSFKYNQPIGEGCWVMPNGNQVFGKFEQIEEREDDADPEEPPSSVRVEWTSLKSVAVRGE